MTSAGQSKSKTIDGKPVSTKAMKQSTKLKAELDKLPWWVEFFFVQIGLPDSWLRSVLKAKKRFKYQANENKGLIIFAFFGLIAIYYIDPIVKQARIDNDCIKGSRNFIIKNAPITTNNDENEIKAWSKRFCNGGDL